MHRSNPKLPQIPKGQDLPHEILPEIPEDGDIKAWEMLGGQSFIELSRYFEKKGFELRSVDHIECIEKEDEPRICLNFIPSVELTDPKLENIYVLISELPGTDFKLRFEIWLNPESAKAGDMKRLEDKFKQIPKCSLESGEDTESKFGGYVSLTFEKVTHAEKMSAVDNVLVLLTAK